MSSSIECPGYTSYYHCSYKEEKTSNGELSGGCDLFERYCKKDYEIGGYGNCPYYKWFMSKYIITAVLNKLFGKNVPEAFVSRKFRTRLEEKNECELKETLKKYDEIGPILARIVENDEELAQNIYSNTIVPAVTLLYKGEDNKALELYMKMVRDLIKKAKELLQNSINKTTPYLVMNHQILSETQSLIPTPIKTLRYQR